MKLLKLYQPWFQGLAGGSANRRRGLGGARWARGWHWPINGTIEAFLERQQFQILFSNQRLRSHLFPLQLFLPIMLF
jgi:hypothetical protein